MSIEINRESETDLRAANARLLAANNRLQEQLGIERARREYLEQHLAWRRAVARVPNSILGDSQKLALHHARDLLIERMPYSEPRPDGTRVIDLASFGAAYGASADTAGANVQYLAERGMVRRISFFTKNSAGQSVRRVAIGATDLLTTFDADALAQVAAGGSRRNHGGTRVTCPSCGGTDVLTRRMHVCRRPGCGTVFDLHERNANPPDGPDDPDGGAPNGGPDGGPDAPAPPDDAGEPGDGSGAPNPAPVAAPCPADPPVGDRETVADLSNLGNLPQYAEKTDRGEGERNRKLPKFDRSANNDPTALLLAIAGTEGRTIRMTGRPGKKYVELPSGITAAIARQHIRGAITPGASLRHPGGLCRAIACDADDTPPFLLLKAAATALHAAGYHVLLEPSPGTNADGSPRGGHLWIFFDQPVDARAAWAAVLALCPELATIPERWPQQGGQAIRLPGGRYIHPDGRREWVKLYDASGAQLSHDGASAWAAIAAHLTPASIVPPLPVVPPAPEPASEGHLKPRPASETAAEADATLARNETDDCRRFRRELAAWYNRRTPLASLAPKEANGYVRASWRAERTPSVMLYEDTGRWVDYGAGGQRPDGTPDSGDAFDLLCRQRGILHGQSKRPVLRDVARDYRAHLARLARTGVVA